MAATKSQLTTEKRERKKKKKQDETHEMISKKSQQSDEWKMLSTVCTNAVINVHSVDIKLFFKTGTIFSVDHVCQDVLWFELYKRKQKKKTISNK